jgi:hypothetical protein
MIEETWLSCSDQNKMVEFLMGKVSDRKLRLLGVAFCRRMWHLIPEGPCRDAVRIAEDFADGLANDTERKEFRKRAQEPLSPSLAERNAVTAVYYLNEKTAGKQPCFVTCAAAIARTASAPYQESRKKSFPIYRSAYCAAKRAEARLARCVFGNPFRPLPSAAPWLARGGDDLRALAEAVYTKRRLPQGTFDPGRIRELLRALKAADCSDPAILTHLRGPGPHVRGCFAIDAILGKP